MSTDFRMRVFGSRFSVLSSQFSVVLLRTENREPRTSLQLFHLNRRDRRVDNKDPVVFAPVEREKIEPIALGVVLRNAANDFAIGELDRDQAPRRLLELILGAPFDG